MVFQIGCTVKVDTKPTFNFFSRNWTLASPSALINSFIVLFGVPVSLPRLMPIERYGSRLSVRDNWAHNF